MDQRLLYSFFKPLEWINRILPKNDERILLYSNMGFRDNVRSLYEYLIRNNYNKKYHIICSLNDYKKYDGTDVKNVTFVSNRRGILYFLTSKYMFYCFGKYPIMPSNRQTVINMWHGMPLKRIGKLEENNAANKYDFFSNVISTSEFFKPYMAEAFGCDENRVLICGQPRTDELFKGEHSRKEFGIGNESIFLWMPTFRYSEKLNVKNGDITSNGLPICNTQEALISLNDVLEKKNAVCFIKIHPMQKASLMLEKEMFSHIRFVDDELLEEKGISLYEFISLSDALITDYSSVYFEYLLLDRPICFTIDDIDKYNKSRGFVTDNPLDMMPGKHVKDIAGLNEFICEVANGIDTYKDFRKLAKDKFNAYTDNNNSRRLLSYCGIE